jgi:hypothetical protein
MNGLMLHSGARSATREAVLAVSTPAATASWRPIPHGDLLAGVQATLDRGGLHTVEEAHGLLIVALQRHQPGEVEAGGIH